MQPPRPPGSVCPWGRCPLAGLAHLPHGDVLWAQGVPLLSTSPFASIPPGTPKVCPGMGQGNLVTTLCPPNISCATWGMCQVLEVQGMEEQDTPDSSCCSTGGQLEHLCAMCGISAKAMSWA